MISRFTPFELWLMTAMLIFVLGDAAILLDHTEIQLKSRLWWNIAYNTLIFGLLGATLLLTVY